VTTTVVRRLIALSSLVSTVRGIKGYFDRGTGPRPDRPKVLFISTRVRAIHREEPALERTSSYGCGGTLDCGTCPSGQTCTNNVCGSGCTPLTCAGLEMNCGTTADGCGGTLTCGRCKKGHTCVNNVCE
jgi:hypothetical protein